MLSSQSDAGRGPSPTVTPIASEGYLCPPGQEYASLEWELANWVVNNKVRGSRRTSPLVGSNHTLFLTIVCAEVDRPKELFAFRRC